MWRACVRGSARARYARLQKNVRITYVRPAEAFVYLAVILDAFSRKVAGWAMADHRVPSWRSMRSPWR